MKNSIQACIFTILIYMKSVETKRTHPMCFKNKNRLWTHSSEWNIWERNVTISKEGFVEKKLNANNRLFEEGSIDAGVWSKSHATNGIVTVFALCIQYKNEFDKNFVCWFFIKSRLFLINKEQHTYIPMPVQEWVVRFIKTNNNKNSETADRCRFAIWESVEFRFVLCTYGVLWIVLQCCMLSCLLNTFLLQRYPCVCFCEYICYCV